MSVRALVGRSRELAGLEAALERAVAGRGNVVLLSGEPGIGKTRLAEELAEVARRGGISVFWGRTWEVPGAPACWPWVQVLQSFAQLPEAAALLDAPAVRAALAPLLRATDVQPGFEDPERATFQLGAALVDLLGSLSRTGARVVILDDLHAGDVASLGLLELVARHLRDMRVLVVGTYRDVEVWNRPRVSALLARLAREGTTLPLGRLDRAAVASWLTGLLASRATPALATAVFTATEGNPLFVEAVAQLLSARGTEVWTGTGRPLPHGVRQALKERLAPVPAETRRILEGASVLGRDFEVQTLQRVCERPIAEMLAAVEVGVAAGLLETGSRSSEPVRFAHVLIREALYEGIPAGERLELHARCARALEAVPDRLDLRISGLAHHRFESAPLGSWPEAADACLRAGERAMALYAFDDAAHHLERTLVALDHAGSKDDLARAEVLWKLGVSQSRMGRSQQGREACERAATLAEREGSAEVLARAALAAGSEIVPGRVDVRLVELLERALVGLAEGSPLRAQVMARLAAAMVPGLNPERSGKLARDAVAEARALGDRRVLAQVLSTARAASTAADDLDERMAADRELAALAQDLGDRLLEVQALGRLALDAIEQGDSEGVRRYLELEEKLADETRVPQHQIRAASTRLLWASLRDDAAEIARAEDLLRALAERVDDGRALASLEASRRLRAELREDASEALEALAALEVHLAREPAAAFWAPLRRAAVFSWEGRREEAGAELARFIPGGPQSMHRALGPWLYTQVAGVCLRTGDRPWMAALHERLLGFAARVSLNTALPASDGPIADQLGRLATALGRPDQAAAHYRDALRLSERAGFPVFEARARKALTLGGQRNPLRPPSSVSPTLLQKEGELWTLTHDERRVRLKDSKGLRYLAVLLAEPGREYHVGELMGLERGPDQSGDAGPLIDARAKAAYRKRLDDLGVELADAEERGDTAAVTRLEEERDALARELARALGLGGRDRKAGSGAERARINVQRRLSDVVRRVSVADAALGRHVEIHLRTGMFCAWEP